MTSSAASEPTTGPAAVWRRATPKGLVLSAAVFILVYWIRLTHHLIPDEVWLLQVVRRLSGGAKLYEDVFFGVGPVSAYLARGVVELGGVRLTVLQLLPAAGYTFSILGSALLVSRLTSRRVAEVLVLVLLSLSLVQGGVYQVLATSLMVATALVSDRWIERHSHSRVELGNHSSWLLPVAAGVLIGLAVATKHNVGVLAGLGVAGAWLTPWGEGPPFGLRVKHLTVAGVAALLTVAVLLLPILTSSAEEAFLRQTITGKALYLGAAGVPFFRELRQELTALLSGSPHGSLGALAFGIPIAAILIIPGALAAAGTHRARLIGIASFAAASAAGLYPRGGLGHVAFQAPLLGAAALIGGWHSTRRGRPIQVAGVAVASLVALACIAWLIFRIIQPSVRLAEGTLVAANLPHLKGSLMERDKLKSIHRVVDGISASDESGVFLLETEASLYWLAGNLENPNRYDYTLLTSMGLEGQQQVRDQIRKGRITTVCVGSTWPEDFEPKLLTHHVQATLRRGADLGACTLYHRN